MNETFNPDVALNKSNLPDLGIELITPLSRHATGLEHLPREQHQSEMDSILPPPRPVVDISRHLRAPKLSNVKPNTVTFEQAYSGVNVNIPGSVQMRMGDTLVFQWGTIRSSTRLHLRKITKDSTVRVLCVSYEFITEPEYGLLEVFYEVHRDEQLIGTSPVIKVTVKGDPTPPAAPRQKKAKPQDNNEQNAA